MLLFSQTRQGSGQAYCINMQCFGIFRIVTEFEQAFSLRFCVFRYAASDAMLMLLPQSDPSEEVLDPSEVFNLAGLCRLLYLFQSRISNLLIACCFLFFPFCLSLSLSLARSPSPYVYILFLNCSAESSNIATGKGWTITEQLSPES